jgi:hypothetical protein
LEATGTSDEITSAVWTNLFASGKLALEEIFQDEEAWSEMTGETTM